ncbi:YlxM family DNA-binding protein [Hazenella coriacea]|uniref:UPF0122 protein EDD58_10962 n=1 Tax=Hazenella coriacea TaxID=1179467 RepID=A0A4R3L3C3_9BACL|nr:YlxM family DNA-binding protein [Hazenella coriacea]TCS93120.1 hypothetical protein EDD58_10962 [Hazenella coriacea]
MLEKTTEMNLLYDFYGLLLTNKQQKLLEMYYLDDWSLGEIADHQGVSRQAVFEAIKRAQKTLTDLESQLGLLQKHLNRQQIAEELFKQIEALPDRDALTQLVKQLIDID